MFHLPLWFRAINSITGYTSSTSSLAEPEQRDWCVRCGMALRMVDDVPTCPKHGSDCNEIPNTKAADWRVE